MGAPASGCSDLRRIARLRCLPPVLTRTQALLRGVGAKSRGAAPCPAPPGDPSKWAQPPACLRASPRSSGRCPLRVPLR